MTTIPWQNSGRQIAEQNPQQDTRRHQKKLSQRRLWKTHKSDHTKSDQLTRKIRTEKEQLGEFETNVSMKREVFTSIHTNGRNISLLNKEKYS